MDGDGFGGNDTFGGDNYGGGNESAPSSSPASSPPTGQQYAGEKGDGGGEGDDGDSSLNLGGLLDLNSLLGPQGFELHAGTNDGDNNPNVSASGIGVEIDALSGEKGSGSLFNASADDNTLLDLKANGPDPDAGIDIGIFDDAPEGDGLVNVASGGDNVIEIGAGDGGLPDNALNAASLDVSAEYDPATGTTIDAAVSGSADNPDTVSLGGLISDGDSLGAALPVVDIVADVGIG